MSYDTRFYSQEAIKEGIPIVARTSSKAHPWNLISSYRMPVCLKMRQRGRHTNPAEGSIPTVMHPFNDLDPANKEWIVNESLYCPDIQSTSYILINMRYTVAWFDPDFFSGTSATIRDTKQALKELEDIGDLAHMVQVLWEGQIDQLANGDASWAGATTFASFEFTDTVKAWPAYVNRHSPLLNEMVFEEYGEKDGLLYMNDLVVDTRSNFPVDWDDPATLPDETWPVRVKLTPSIASAGDIDYGPKGSGSNADFRIKLTGFSAHYFRI